MELDRDSILEALARIALSKPNDAVALALAPREQHVPGLDLWGVSEFKMSSTGGVEVRTVWARCWRPWRRTGGENQTILPQAEAGHVLVGPPVCGPAS